MKKNCLGDYLIIGEVMIIGLTEAVHLITLLLEWSFTRCAILCGGFSGAVILCGGLFGLFFRRDKSQKVLRRAGELCAAEKILYGIFAILFVSQLISVCLGDNKYRQGDMTLETVNSFLTADGIYQVNPMTGAPYTAGMPFRLKILCLPTLYAGICKITGLAPALVVQKLIPVITLISCYAAFHTLARSLFPAEENADGRKRACFLAVTALFLWVGTYRYGMDGFNLLYCGWRGVTIRNCVLIPWLISLCIRRKWLSMLLCILAESCIVWTLYGCGWCLFLAVGMTAAGVYCQKGLKKVQGRNLREK